jgi:hypothetical protein
MHATVFKFKLKQILLSLNIVVCEGIIEQYNIGIKCYIIYVFNFYICFVGKKKVFELNNIGLLMLSLSTAVIGYDQGYPYLLSLFIIYSKKKLSRLSFSNCNLISFCCLISRLFFFFHHYSNIQIYKVISEFCDYLLQIVRKIRVKG